MKVLMKVNDVVFTISFLCLARVIYFPSACSIWTSLWLCFLQKQIKSLFGLSRPVIVHGVNAIEPRDVLYFGANVMDLVYVGNS